VLFGGMSDSLVLLQDTWAWQGTVWVRRAAAGPPVARADFAMAYDAARDEVVLHGGYDGTTVPRGDTWVWNGTTWTQRTLATAQPLRSSHALAYDAVRERVVLFGGGSDTGTEDETWEWDGTTWELRHPLGSPPMSFQLAMAWDGERRRVVQTGGTGAFDGDDVWEYDGTTWEVRHPTTVPQGRLRHALAYDVLRRETVVFGGHGSLSTYLNDTWGWNGTDWALLTSASGAPSKRDHHAMAYDLAGRQVVLFGGQYFDGVTTFWLDDTWVLRQDALETVEETCLGFDADHDGRFGCDDPDCFGYCTPLCVPGETCDGTGPRCGDGVCQPVESCALCPADCDACDVCGDLRCDGAETAATCPGDCALCGDGVRQATEACDDGNLLPGDGCSPQCLTE
jgi:cysteine-rich repeat protein